MKNRKKSTLTLIGISALIALMPVVRAQEGPYGK
jgi:hypothetical protein